MNQVTHIFKKEFKSYFISPIAYIVIVFFLLITGWFYFAAFFLNNQASLRDFFGMLPIIFTFVIPAVTMKLFSEEYNVGSYETLLTLPVTYLDVILGKFFSAVAFVTAMLIPTIAYPITILFLGQLDWGPVIGGYIGAVLLGAAYSSIGLFASAMTRNQIISLIIGLVICFVLTMIDRMLFFLPQSMLGFFEYIGAGFHFQNISRGIIDSRDILYFLSVSFAGIYCTYLAIQGKR